MGAEGRGFAAGCEEGWCMEVLMFDRPLGRRVQKVLCLMGEKGSEV